MKHLILTFSLILLFNCSCKNKAPETLTEEYAPTFDANVSVGSFYKTRGLSNFYDIQPDSLVIKTPTRVIGPGHVIQLLDPNSGGGWARVSNEKDEIGYVQFSRLKIVPMEEQPSRRRKDKFKELGE